MRGVWLVVLFLVPSAAADTLYGHDADGLILSLDPEDPRADGQVAAPSGSDGQATWSFRLDPAPQALWRLDPGRNVTAQVGIGAATGSGNVEVSWTLEAGGPLANGTAQAVLYTLGYEVLTWEEPVVREAYDPRASGLWWNVTAVGTFSQVFLSVAGDDRGRIDVPIAGREPILEEPAPEVHDLSGKRVEIRWDLPAPDTRVLLYRWSPDGDVELTYDVALEAGTVQARLADERNHTQWQGQWPGTPSGMQDLPNATGNWTLELGFDQAVGDVEIVMAHALQTTTTTKQKGPLPVWLALAGLGWAVRRR